VTTGAWILIAAVSLAVIFGLWRMLTDGSFRAADSSSADAVEDTVAVGVIREAGAELGERATLLQFSSAFCAPCRTTRVVLADVAGQVDGVAHVEVDADEHLDATRVLGIMRTPTTVVLDARGVEVSRASGAPNREQVLVALDKAI
jgi:thiol-disulfide isomerase/thioredoxin